MAGRIINGLGIGAPTSSGSFLPKRSLWRVILKHVQRRQSMYRVIFKHVRVFHSNHLPLSFEATYMYSAVSIVNRVLKLPVSMLRNSFLSHDTSPHQRPVIIHVGRRYLRASWLLAAVPNPAFHSSLCSRLICCWYNFQDSYAYWHFILSTSQI
jgi:hypothetical protein